MPQPQPNNRDHNEAPNLRQQDEGEIANPRESADTVTQTDSARQESDLGHWAEIYAKAHYHIFPLVPGQKNPLTEHGLLDATDDLEQVRAWWQKWPNANIGWRIPASYLVVDVDPRSGGSLEQLGEMPKTPRSRTGGGGWQFVTAVPTDVELCGKFRGLTGIDVRKLGNYVVLPPSVHPSGNRYVWEVPPANGVKPQPLPTHLLERVKKLPRPERSESDEDIEAEPERAAEYFLARAKEECAPGKRNEIGFWLACQLRDNGLDEAQAERMMLDYCDYANRVGGDAYEEQEALNSLQQAYSQPAREPTNLGHQGDDTGVPEYDGEQETDHAMEFGSPPQKGAKPRKRKGAEPPPAPDDDMPLGVRLSDVTAATVEWLWQDRIPRGMLTTLEADPGEGKSFLALTIAAHVTKGGTFPDGKPVGEPRNVIVISAEDDLTRTILPRMQVAGADLNRVISLSMVPYKDGNGDTQERPFILPYDLPVLRRAIEQEQAALVILDPIMAMLDSSVDSNTDQDVRSKIATPLKRLAEETGCALLIVRHFTKGSVGQKLVYRGGGSIAWTGAARMGTGVDVDPDDSTRKLWFVFKCNIAPFPKPLRYRIISSTIANVGVVEWSGQSKHDVNSIAQARKQRQHEERMSPRMQAVLDYVVMRKPNKVSVADVAAALGIGDDSIRKCLDRLYHNGYIHRDRGQYWSDASEEELRQREQWADEWNKKMGWADQSTDAEADDQDYDDDLPQGGSPQDDIPF